MLDQYTAFVNDEGRDNLGAWIIRQQKKNIQPKQIAAQKVLRDCGVPEAELRQEWEVQKVVQSSIRSRKPSTSVTPVQTSNSSQMLLPACAASSTRFSNSNPRLTASKNQFPKLRTPSPVWVPPPDHSNSFTAFN
jgi:hypothetical protein